LRDDAADTQPESSARFRTAVLLPTSGPPALLALASGPAIDGDGEPAKGKAAAEHSETRLRGDVARRKWPSRAAGDIFFRRAGAWRWTRTAADRAGGTIFLFEEVAG